MITREVFEESLSNPLLYWSGKSKDEVKSLLGEDSSAMVAFDQRNPHHCYDLFMHSLHTVDALDKSSSVNLRVAAFSMILANLGLPWRSRDSSCFMGMRQNRLRLPIRY